jgi:hypothetical protein
MLEVQSQPYTRRLELPLQRFFFFAFSLGNTVAAAQGQLCLVKRH